MESGDQSIFDSVKQILIDKNYRRIMPLRKGGFADVLSAIGPNKNRIAIKIIRNENSWPFEEHVWPKLKHRHVLELLDVIDVKHLNLKLYLMPRHPFPLNKMISRSRFLSDKNGLERVKRWLFDVLDGLDYMHASGYAHTDLKTDNVLISSEDRGVICDFSGISRTSVPLKR